CNTTDRLERWYSGDGAPAMLKLGAPQVLWLTQGTWCVGGDISAPGHALKIVGTHLSGSRNCLKFDSFGNAASRTAFIYTTKGYCLTISGSSKASGAHVNFGTCDGGNEQRFHNSVALPAHTNGLNKPVYFVHGYDFGIPAAISSYWGNMIDDFLYSG